MVNKYFHFDANFIIQLLSCSVRFEKTKPFCYSRLKGRDVNIDLQIVKVVSSIPGSSRAESYTFSAKLQSITVRIN